MSRVQVGGEEGKGLFIGDNCGKQQEQRFREINVHGMARGESWGTVWDQTAGKGEPL